MKENKAWNVVDTPPSSEVLKPKWVFRIKEYADGNPKRYRARLVAKGFLQKYGVDYIETFAKVA